MLIDWLTLRCSLSLLTQDFRDKLSNQVGFVTKIDSSGVQVYCKPFLDMESIRSDDDGLFVVIQGDGKDYFFVIAASPASIQHGINVFGSLDVAECAQVLIAHAAKSYDTTFPVFTQWQCRRIDVTANYDLGSYALVLEALQLLLQTNAPVRRASSPKKGGNSVYWNISSDRRKGKAYHKGVHLTFLRNRRKHQISDEVIELSNRLLRLELQLGARWFREDLKEMGKEWYALTHNDLTTEHFDYFAKLLGRDFAGANDMATLLDELEKVTMKSNGVIRLITKGMAAATHNTWLSIQRYGYLQTLDRMPSSTFRRHVQILKLVGFSSADICAGKPLPIRRSYLTLSRPVLSFDDVRHSRMVCSKIIDFVPAAQLSKVA